MGEQHMHRWVGAALTGLCCLAFPCMASASSVYATGFEPPGYTTGALAGQGGWSDGPGTVETSTVFAGTQAVGFDATGLTGQSINIQFLPSSGQAPIERVTDEFFVTASDPNIYWEILAVDGDAGFLGQLVVNNGSAYLGLADSTVGSVPITIGAWNSYTMDFDFLKDRQTAYVNGTVIGSGPFASPSTLLADVGIGINVTYGSTSQAYADDLSINPIETFFDAPEPSSLLVLGLGVVALGLRSKRSHDDYA